VNNVELKIANPVSCKVLLDFGFGRLEIFRLVEVNVYIAHQKDFIGIGLIDIKVVDKAAPFDELLDRFRFWRKTSDPHSAASAPYALHPRIVTDPTEANGYGCNWL